MGHIMIKRLTNHKSAQCHVVVEEKVIEFWSYSTMVIRATNILGGVWSLNCTGTYSQTTRRQIGWFLKEYFGELDYYDMKLNAENELIITYTEYQGPAK